MMIIVGFVPALPSLPGLTDGSVILIDEPDVIRKRDVRSVMSGAAMLREIVEWEYQLPGADDAFADTRPDLDPAAVAPLVEYATPFAARLAERYGLPGAGSGAAQIMRDKSLLRTVTGAAGIRNPRSQSAETPQEVRRFLARHPGGVVLKPANRQGSVGTKILHEPGEVDRAWQECLRQDEGVMVPDRPVPVRMLVERYVRGEEYSVEMLVRDGVPLFTNITEKILFPGSRPVELGHLVPADLPTDLAALLETGTVDVLRAVGFGSGVVHCEWILSGGVPYLVECAGRFPGDGIPLLIDRAYPVSLAEHYYTIMRGEQPPPLPQHAGSAAAIRFLQVEPGEVTAVEGVDAARSLPGVISVSVTATPGDTVRELRSSWDRVGSVMATASTPSAALTLAEKAAGQIRIHTTPASAARPGGSPGGYGPAASGFPLIG